MSIPMLLPPYLLEAIAERGPEPAAERARATLRRDAEIRSARSTTSPAPPTPAPGATPGQPNRTIFSANNTEQLPGDEARAEGAPATGDPAVDEAYDGLGATWQLFFDAYSRDSLDGRGMPMLGTVHYGTDYANAFWDGKQMVFGDGDGELFNRFTASLDVIGHELSHGVIEFTAGLRYADQSGALNESVADVFGALVKQHQLGQTADQADWLIGAELFTDKVRGVALRSMIEPGSAYDDPVLGKDPQPGHMDGFVTTTDDNGGVHINSGIPNKAFQLAATALGGNAWERAGAIWYAALTGDQISADCDFATFARLTSQAAAAIGETEAEAVRRAWAEVGLPVDEAPDAEQRPAPAPPSEPAPSSEPAPPSEPGAPDDRIGDDAELYLGRSGGFTGMSRSREFRLGELSPPDADSWRQLLGGPELTTWSRSDAPEPDRYTYRVACRTVPLDVQLPEPELPDQVRELFHRTLDG